MVGRPPKLSHALIKRICDCVRLGSWLETAAAYCGIHRQTLWEWGKRGNEALIKQEKGETVAPIDQLCISLVEKVHEATSECEMIDLKRIDKFADDIWQAAAWRLERRFPQRYSAKREQAEEQGIVDGENKSSTNLKLSDLPQEIQDSIMTFWRAKNTTLSLPAPKDDNTSPH